MPLYRYTCTRCAIEFVDLRGINEAAPDHCGKAMAKLMPRRVVGRVVPDSNGVHTGSGFARSGVPAPEPSKPSGAQLWDVQAAMREQGSDIEMLGGASDPLRPQNRFIAPEIDPTDPTMIPQPPSTGVWAKDYEDCDAAERDERWRDSTEALATWHAKGLDTKGSEPANARAFASQAAQQTIERARADLEA